MPSKKYYALQMNKCFIAFLIGFIPFCVYGFFSPFTKSYLIFLYAFYIFLNFFYFLIVIHISEIFIVFYFLIAGVVGALLFFSVLHYVYIMPILFLGALAIAFILYREVKQKYLRNTLVVAQALFFLLICFALLNLNILHIDSTGLHIFHPLVVFDTGPFFLFMGYSAFNVGKLLNDHELIKYGVVSTLGLLYLSLGITIMLVYYKLPILAAICFVLGLMATIYLFSYYNKEFNKAKRKSQRKKKNWKKNRGQG